MCDLAIMNISPLLLPYKVYFFVARNELSKYRNNFARAKRGVRDKKRRKERKRKEISIILQLLEPINVVPQPVNDERA